jgi:hypothetical protein
VARTAAVPYIPRRKPPPFTEPSAMSDTARLFMYMAIFGTFTFVVFLTCLWMIRIEERRQARRSGRR